MGKLKSGCGMAVIGIVAILWGLSELGSNLDEEVQSPRLGLIDDALVAARMELTNADAREMHYLAEKSAICGIVKHQDSKIGYAPFAYSHKLGLSVASVWGRGEYEELNRSYGCSFLPIAYNSEWERPDWGKSDTPDEYLRQNGTLRSR